MNLWLLTLFIGCLVVSINLVESKEFCSDAIELEKRVVSSFTSTEELKRLRGVLDDVVTEEKCHYLFEGLDPLRFVSSLGYEDGSAYNAPIGYSGLGLKELA